MAKITNAVFGAGGNIMAFSQSLDASGTRWQVTFKVQDVPRAQLVEIIRPVVENILDVRES